MLANGAFRLSERDQDTTGPGSGRLFSYPSVCRLAVAVAIARAGVHKRLAARLADDFFSSPPSKTHPNLLVAELTGTPRLLVDQPEQTGVSLWVNAAQIVADVDARLAEGAKNAA
jgi:hypothetical protein